MITAKQIKIIHTLKNLIGMNNELYRDVLLSYGTSSSKNLSQKDACSLINLLEDKAIALNKWEKPDAKFEELGNRCKMATPSQLRKIEATWVDFLKKSNGINSRSSNPLIQGKEVKRSLARKSLRKLLQRVHHISDLRFLPKEKVSKVLKTIETMINQISQEKQSVFPQE